MGSRSVASGSICSGRWCRTSGGRRLCSIREIAPQFKLFGKAVDVNARYTEDTVDLCDVLSSFSSQAKATLHELSRVMGLPGKPDGMTGGAEVEKYYRDGHIREIADYCESDVVNTYRAWLRYELFRGRLSEPEFQGSEANLLEFVMARGNTKPHLTGLL
jgi:predicted PolB exonuclease-like 3'-5' exonuclease